METEFVINDLLRRVPGARPGPERCAFVEDGMLVLKVRTGTWWVEVYGRPGGAPPRVDAEMAPHRQLLDALNAYHELTLWVLGSAR